MTSAEKTAEEAMPGGSPTAGKRTRYLLRAIVAMLVAMVIAAVLLIGRPIVQVRAVVLEEKQNLSEYRAAIAQLGGSASAARKISIYLCVPGTAHRDRAVWLLGICGNEAVPVLSSALRSSSADIRLAAALSLRYKKAPDAIPMLVTAVREDVDSRVRAMAAKSVGITADAGDPTVSAQLLEVVGKDQSIDVRRAAIYAVGRIGCRDAVPALLKVTNNRSEIDAVREASIMSLGRMADKRATMPILSIVLSEEESYGVRFAAAQFLGMIRDERAIGPLMNVVKDPSLEAWRPVALALGAMRVQDAIPILIRCLSEKNPLVRGGAAQALGGIGSQAACKALTALLNDESEGVRAEARAALDEIASAQAPSVTPKSGTSGDKPRLDRE